MLLGVDKRILEVDKRVFECKNYLIIRLCTCYIRNY